ncbi:hypothetical protein [Rhodoligotrophos defluvii]|uniref:hypothetical protein n=1 Tax=Rhodoligotrophos defluvii TaxID=2561934 RepID=UPI0010C94BCE|nr:hypothetical protein [Rhodoligotrophos defluvii]
MRKALAGALVLIGIAASTAPAQAAVRAVVGVTPEGETCFLGGAQAGSFLSAEQVARQASFNQPYVLANLTGLLQQVTAIGMPALTETGDCEASYMVELALAEGQPGAFAVALSGSESEAKALLPASISLEKPDGRARRVLGDHLEAAGLAKPELKFKQVISVDLDGDKRDELIVNAAHLGEEGAGPGDYSVLLVVKGDEVIPIHSDVVPPEDQQSEILPALLDNEVVAVVDLDGDGIFEIVNYSAFDFGDGWELVSLKQGKAKHLLWCGCGG